jgi:hypothetical protein
LFVTGIRLVPVVTLGIGGRGALARVIAAPSVLAAGVLLGLALVAIVGRLGLVVVALAFVV